MKKKLSFKHTKRNYVLLLALLFTCIFLTGCGQTLSGKFTSESGIYSVKFDSDKDCTWYQNSTFFPGTYYWDNNDKCFYLEIKGGGLYGNTVFSAKVDTDGLIINGGHVSNELFKPESSSKSTSSSDRNTTNVNAGTSQNQNTASLEVKNEKGTSSAEKEKNEKETSSAEEVKNAKGTFSVEEVKNAKAGDVIKFGSYEQDNNLSNGKEPIEWQVVDNNWSGHKLLLSKYALDCKKYNESWKDITWENCTLRSWLNNDFYNSAFSDSDKKWIVTAHNYNPDSYKLYEGHNTRTQTNGAEGGNETDDKVFLLSWGEVCAYFDGDVHYSSRGAENYNQKLLCRPTAYVKALGIETSQIIDDYPSDTLGCCWWWLRSPGTSPTGAAAVNACGAIGTTSVNNYGMVGVRPAIFID